MEEKCAGLIITVGVNSWAKFKGNDDDDVLHRKVQSFGSLMVSPE